PPKNGVSDRRKSRFGARRSFRRWLIRSRSPVRRRRSGSPALPCFRELRARRSFHRNSADRVLEILGVPAAFLPPPERKRRGRIPPSELRGLLALRPFLPPARSV